MEKANPDCDKCGGRTVKKITSPAVIKVMGPGHIPVRSKGYKEGYSKEYLRDVGSVAETQGQKP